MSRACEFFEEENGNGPGERGLDPRLVKSVLISVLVTYEGDQEAEYVVKTVNSEPRTVGELLPDISETIKRMVEGMKST